MATLSCDAKNCMHNDAPYCCIYCVGGTKAMTEAETCCDNFKEKGGMAMNSACGQSRPNLWWILSAKPVTVSITKTITAGLRLKHPWPQRMCM